MKTNILNSQQATKSITSAKSHNKPVNDFLEIIDIKKSCFKNLSPPTIQKEIDAFVGTGNARLVLWRTM